MTEDGGAAVLEGAQSKFALFLAILLQRAGVAPVAEFAELLELFARTVAETDPAEGAVLARWAQLIGSTAGH